MALAPVMFLLNSCEGTEPDPTPNPDGPGPVELPEPPEQEKSSNVFVVDFFSTLEESSDIEK